MKISQFMRSKCDEKSEHKKSTHKFNIYSILNKTYTNKESNTTEELFVKIMVAM